MTPMAGSETRRASSRSWPRISSASRASSPPPLRISRVIIRFPPEARALTTTPGSWFSERRSAMAISLLVRSRSTFSTSVTVIEPRWLDAPPNGPRPPPTCVVTFTASGTSAPTISSNWSITVRVRSKRVPMGSCALMRTSPSSTSGVNSTAMVGASSTVTQTSPPAARSTVGRWASAT